MRFSNRFGIGLIGVCALLLLLSSPLYAGFWTTIGGACTVDDKSIELAALSQALQHKSGTTGTIAARCNVVDVEEENEWDTLFVTYRDPDGPGTDYQVNVTLFAVKDSNGRIKVLVPFQSNAQDIVGTGGRGVPFTYDFDFNNEAYYLFVTVFRANTDDSAKFFRAEIRP